jgi:hypothetical protein
MGDEANPGDRLLTAFQAWADEQDKKGEGRPYISPHSLGDGWVCLDAHFDINAIAKLFLDSGGSEMAKDTIMVFSKEDQREICIARHSFDPALHTYVNPEDEKAAQMARDGEHDEPVTDQIT